MQLLLQQYNRMTRQQHSAGQQLVSLSEHSLNLQARLSISTLGGSAQEHKVQAAAAGAEAGSSSCTHAQANDLRKSMHMNMDSSPDLPAADRHSPCNRFATQHQQDAAAAHLEEGLDALLAQHVSSRLGMIRLMQVWVMCTLTPWQMGEMVTASWPYHAFSCVLVELSPYLVPDDTPRLTINAECCEEAAQAAALADELGFTSAHHFVQQRCQALEAQLQWALQQENHHSQV